MTIYHTIFRLMMFAGWILALVFRLIKPIERIDPELYPKN